MVGVVTIREAKMAVEKHFMGGIVAGIRKILQIIFSTVVTNLQSLKTGPIPEIPPTPRERVPKIIPCADRFLNFGGLRVVQI